MKWIGKKILVLLNPVNVYDGYNLTELKSHSENHKHKMYTVSKLLAYPNKKLNICVYGFFFTAVISPRAEA